MSHPYGPPNVISKEDVARAAYGAGFRGDALTTIVAIAGPESGYDTTNVADDPSTGDYSVGLWQINYYGANYPERTRLYGTPDQLAGDINMQAKAAYDISGGGTHFTDWGAYNNNKHLSFMDDAQAAVNAIMGGATMPGAIGSPQHISSPTQDQKKADNTKYFINFDTHIPGVPAIHVLMSTARKAEGIGVLLGGGIITLVGLALLMGKEINGYVPNVSGAPGYVKNAKLERTINKGSQVASPSRDNFNKAKAGNRVNPSKTVVDSDGNTF